MSVFTPITETELSELLEEAGLQLLAFRPASAGIENSNYLIDANDNTGMRADVVLTLFERLPATALPWYAEVLARAAAVGLPVPCPLAHPRGTIFSMAGKPAMLVPRLPGHHLDQPEPRHCRQIGVALAQLHGIQISNPAPQGDERSLLAARLNELEEGEEKTHAREHIDHWLNTGGPRVLVHADLFRDNALFKNDQLTGLLDFYNACHDHPVYDLAVAINDWCVDTHGKPLPEHEQAMLHGYQSVRTLTSEELALLPEALTIAALRFWLSRLAGQQQSAIAGQGSKDPEEFARLYRLRRQALSG
ncbi:homoserine kinase [Alcanivorax sp. 1008]|uniref:homoserine kinase n=1 Tax=Alcanivorax sp. 1008 TaxID=2816853 RepID=UPI001DADB2B4|nr:homoserine kinase [Alcanivorax sp. 1008]MCC1496063.1 homoserine kinase [Alcanivorax sp. 1008]